MQQAYTSNKYKKAIAHLPENGVRGDALWLLQQGHCDSIKRCRLDGR